MVKYGYKGAFAQCLVVLARYPAGLTAAQLCEICDRDKAAVSRIAAEMEQKGLILREGGSDNRYRARLKLTPEGQKAADYVCRKAKVAVAAVGEQLTDEERIVLYRALDLIASGLHTLSKEGIPSHEFDE